MWVPCDQTQPGSFSRERKEPGNKVGDSGHLNWMITDECLNIKLKVSLRVVKCRNALTGIFK